MTKRNLWVLVLSMLLSVGMLAGCEETDGEEASPQTTS